MKNERHEGTARLGRLTAAMAVLPLILAACATPSGEDRSGVDGCVTGLSGFAVYNGQACRTCENVHVAAEGEPRRCGATGQREQRDTALMADDGSADDDSASQQSSADFEACPETPAGELRLAESCGVIEVTGVNFRLDSDRLTGSAREALAESAEVLAQNPGVRVEIGGHTDAQGGAAYNRRLSRDRAESVRAFLVDRGIAAERLQAVGYGEAEPVATNATAEGRAANRRVELRILGEANGSDQPQ